MKLLEMQREPGTYTVALLDIWRGKGIVRVTLARTVRLDVGRDYVQLRWSTEALNDWLCRRNVHRLRDDFQMDCIACACRRVRLPNEWERERMHAAWVARQEFIGNHLAMLRVQMRLSLVMSTPDVHSLWKGTLL